MPLTQHSDDPNGFVWILRAQGGTGKSRDWIAARCQVYRIGRRDYVKIEDINAALVEDSTPKPRGDNA